MPVLKDGLAGALRRVRRGRVDGHDPKSCTCVDEAKIIARMACNDTVDMDVYEPCEW